MSAVAAVPAAATPLGQVADGPLAGWPIIADGQGGSLAVSPSTSCFSREANDTVTSTLHGGDCWDVIDLWLRSDAGRRIVADHKAARARRYQQRLEQLTADGVRA